MKDLPDTRKDAVADALAKLDVVVDLFTSRKNFPNNTNNNDENENENTDVNINKDDTECRTLGFDIR